MKYEITTHYLNIIVVSWKQCDGLEHLSHTFLKHGDWKIVKCYITRSNNNYNINCDEMIILNKYMKNSFGSLSKQTTVIIIIIIIIIIMNHHNVN